MNKIFEYLIIFSFVLVAILVSILVLCLIFPASVSFPDSGLMGIIIICVIIGVFMEVYGRPKENAFETEGGEK